MIHKYEYAEQFKQKNIQVRRQVFENTVLEYKKFSRKNINFNLKTVLVSENLQQDLVDCV